MCIFSKVPSPVLVFDTAGHLVDANEAGLQYHDSASVAGIKETLQGSELWKTLIKYVNMALSGVSGVVQYSFILHGEKRWVKAAVNPIKDEKGTLIGVSVLEKDVTLKRKMLSELKQMNMV